MKPTTTRYRYFGWWPTIAEWRVLAHDVKMRLRGVCNDSPRRNDDGGYHHWRCQLDRAHDGLHRYRNYVWGDGQHTRHEPLSWQVGFPNGDPQVPGFGMSYAARRAEVRRLERLAPIYGDTIPARDPETHVSGESDRG